MVPIHASAPSLRLACVLLGPAVTLTPPPPRYTTAYTESDCTDRDSEKGDGNPEPEEDSEDEEKSCATVLTLRQEDSQEEDEDEREMAEEGAEDAERSLRLMTGAPSNGELALLLAQSDVLHTGDAALKAEGFHLLLENRAEVRDGHFFPPHGSLRPWGCCALTEHLFSSVSTGTAGSSCGDWPGLTATCISAPRASRRKRCTRYKVTVQNCSDVAPQREPHTFSLICLQKDNMIYLL